MVKERMEIREKSFLLFNFRVMIRRERTKLEKLMIFEIFSLIDCFVSARKADGGKEYRGGWSMDVFCIAHHFPAGVRPSTHEANSTLRLFAKQENILQLGSAIHQTASKSNVAKFNIYPLFGYKSRGNRKGWIINGAAILHYHVGITGIDAFLK